MASRFLVLFMATVLGSAALQADGERKKEPTLNDLSLEVNALHLMYQLHLTRPQLELVGKLAKETAERSGARRAVKLNDAFAKAAKALREALLEGTDDDKIEELTEELLDIREKEKLELDDVVDITDEARKEAPGLLKKLSPRQLALYAAGIADILHDPNEVLIEAFVSVRAADEKEWRALRDSVSDQVGHLLGGLDDSRFDEIADKVAQLLIVVRSLEDDEFKKRREEMEKQVRELVGDLGPTDILRNVMERALAELLSNPQLPAAVAARLERLEKDAAKK